MPKWPSLTRKTAWTIRQVIRRRHWNRALPIICGRPSAATPVSPCPRNTRYSGQCVSLRAGADCFPFLFFFFVFSVAAFGLFGECRHRRIGCRGSQPNVLGEAFTAGSVQETFRSLMSTSLAADAAIHGMFYVMTFFGCAVDLTASRCRPLICFFFSFN